ncbi:hypothetical protein BDN71DRAFT_1452985 [Pleurotus eryngii]|uniref:Aminoglycoside phosphotransferase domain-containing protein n=1 Tax=Pleurotus eryngii TaxID=5323 RepID=A0A9P5ZNK9_PLEER|nr:hypothetical protein BDN71DRAFT_1452985 [Pleurotus eryngii]
MSAFYPDFNLDALKQFAIETVAAEHRSRNAIGGTKQSNTDVQPRILRCKNLNWGGDEMIMVEFDPESLPLGPRTMMAHFPKGRPGMTTQALIGMTATMRTIRLRPQLQLVIPQVYGFKDFLPNPIGAEVVLLQKIAGHPLDEVWHTLPSHRRLRIVGKVTEFLLAMFNYRSDVMHTELQGSSTGGMNTSAITGNREVLLAPAFDQGPLATLPPQSAVGSTEEYLRAVSSRVDRVFASPETNQAARKSNHPDEPPLSDEDVARIRETWKRLARLIPFHIGGFYLPNTLSKEAYEMAQKVLQSPQFGIHHSDMQMSRFIVDFSGPLVTYSSGEGGATWTEPDVIVGLTGWEHARWAPLWSCARMPKWLQPHITPGEIVPWERQSYYRSMIMAMVARPGAIPNSLDWIIAYVYGATERWFEGCLSSHWKFRDTIEVLLTRLKFYWAEHKPEVAFPLPVGKAYAAIAQTSVSIPMRGPEPAQTNEEKRIAKGKRKSKSKAKAG